MFLGNMQFMEDLKGDTLMMFALNSPPPFPLLSTPLNVLSLSAIHMYRGRAHDYQRPPSGWQRKEHNPNLPPRHPWIKQDPCSQMIIISHDPMSPGTTIHPLEVAYLLKFEALVHGTAENRCFPINQYPYRLMEYNPQTSQECYCKLTIMGILSSKGDIEECKLNLIQIALDQPFDDIYRCNVYFQQQGEELLIVVGD
ncbi:hypothetical protein C0995_009592 [Termitomyces sp. Mi166|nr:hypothetical protein C0995_009592 [Termitomyces sp. Mi166\